MKRKLISYLSVLFVSIIAITNVNATQLFEAGENITQEGKYDSIRFVAGNNVINKAEVDGLSFIAGNEITLNGSAPYGFYAGNIVNVSENISKDMFVAGNNVTISNDATIGRDLFVAGNIVNINSNVTRDLYAGGTVIDLSGIKIGGNAIIDAEEIIFDENTVIVGKLSYYENTKVTGIEKAVVGSTKINKNIDINIEMTFKEKVTNYVMSIVTAFITMSIIFLFIPKIKEKVNNLKITANDILKSIGIGFALLILVPVVSIIALFTGILTPLALVTIVLYIFSIYLSTILASYVVGKLINTKLFKNENVYLSLFIGIIIVRLLKLIPVVGGLIGVAALFYGLGIIYNIINSKK